MPHQSAFAIRHPQPETPQSHRATAVWWLTLWARPSQNLQGALRWAESGAPVRDRNKRSFWLSAARSALFNQQVSIRLKKTEFNQVVDGDALQLAGRGSWFVVTPEELEVSQARVHNRELMITATLPGSGDWGSQRDALAFEQAAIAEETALQALLVLAAAMLLTHWLIPHPWLGYSSLSIFLLCSLLILGNALLLQWPLWRKRNFSTYRAGILSGEQRLSFAN